MTQRLDGDVLLAALGSALAPEQVEPGPGAIAALHQALEARRSAAIENGSAVVVAFSPWKRRTASWAGIHRLRQPMAAVVAIGVLATSGVAAAGVATDHLPGPTRNVAYALGLPVTSPALASAQGTIAHLRVALAAHDVTQIQALATLLRTQLASLSAADRDSIKATTTEQLSQADNLVQVATVGKSSGPNRSNGSNGSSSSNGLGGSTSSANSANSGTSAGTTKGGATPSSGESTNDIGTSSGGSPPGTAGPSEGSPGGTTPGTSSPGTSSPGTTEPGDGSSGGSTPTPTTTPTTTPGTTATTEPGEIGDGTEVGLYSQSTARTAGPSTLS